MAGFILGFDEKDLPLQPKPHRTASIYASYVFFNDLSLQPPPPHTHTVERYPFLRKLMLKGTFM